ncbi:hypothetical protein [Poseidonocella sp. HB161398]|uniref:hypothetical protein n=1 Tax=Poseidonocella sp. HB161398 TaxID=2320855 RepID=UPI001486FCCA|nr:hypothetical protein [Poseidonocella sp. HB161398]
MSRSSVAPPARSLGYVRARLPRDDFRLAGAAGLPGRACGISVAAFDWLATQIQLAACGLGTGGISGAGAMPLDRLWAPLANSIAVGTTIWLAARRGRRLEKGDPTAMP